MAKETKGELIYRCRRCGANTKRESPNIWKALDDARNPASFHSYHQCNDTEIGITELLGADIVE